MRDTAFLLEVISLIADHYGDKNDASCRGSDSSDSEITSKGNRANVVEPSAAEVVSMGAVMMISPRDEMT